MSAADKTFLLRCDCAGGCTVLSLDYWADERDGDQWFAEFYAQVHKHAALRWRLRTAWAILRGRDHYLDALVLHPAQMRELRDFLVKEIPA